MGFFNVLGLEPILDFGLFSRLCLENKPAVSGLNFDLGFVLTEPFAKAGLSVLSNPFFLFIRAESVNNINLFFIEPAFLSAFVLAEGDNLGANLPTFFANASFLFLFLAMSVYWIDLAFIDSKKQSLTQAVNFNAVLDQENIPENSFGASGGLQKRNSIRENLGKYSLLLSNISLIVLLCIRWKDSGHFPLSNLYESLMFLSWSCTSIHLFLILYAPTVRSFPSNSSNLLFSNKTVAQGIIGTQQSLSVDKPFFEKLLGAVLAPLALFLNAFATFSLPQEMQLAGPLVPALQSNWLMMHVTVMIISYAALILGSLLSIVFVIAINLYKSKTTLRAVDTQKEYSNNKVFANLDYLSYRIIGIGFPFLTIGILSGAVWANEAWGSYWSWDPKETWALLTWLIFAIYLHTRLTKGWEGEKPALIASFGFIVVWVCYLGVNLLGEGLHSYGFFNT